MTVFNEIKSIEKLKLFSLILIWAALFAPIVPEMVREWMGHSDNSHGFIVPLVTGYFIWDRRKQLKSAVVGSSWWGGILLFLSLALYALSYAGGLAFPARVAMINCSVLFDLVCHGE